MTFFVMLTTPRNGRWHISNSRRDLVPAFMEQALVCLTTVGDFVGLSQQSNPIYL